MPCPTQKMVTRLNAIAITQQANENNFSKKYGATLCSAQAVYPVHSKGHLPLITEELNAIVTELCWLCPCSVI